MRILLLSVIYFLFFTSCYRPSPKQAFEDLKSLEGKWQTIEGAQFNEVWTLSNDSLLSGMGYSLNATDTAFKEILEIYRSGNQVFYGALVDHNSGFVYFELAEAKKALWKFVNPDHDYPNIINYQLVNDSILLATTTNIRGNKEIEFRFKRVRK